ncbi:MAG: tail fiber domain-containing protein, partial [Paludibacter sp.]
VLFCFFTLNSAYPQVAINTDGAQPNTKSILDVASTTLGVLLPRMTSEQRTAITSPPQGLLVFQIDGGVNAGLYYATGVGNNWTLIFHSNTTAITGTGSQNYIPYWTGTNALAFTGMYWDNTNSRLGIGTTTPSGVLQVNSSSTGIDGKVIISSPSSNFSQFQIGNPSGTEASMLFIPGVTSFGNSPASSNGNSAIWSLGGGIYGISSTTFGIGNYGYGGSILNVKANGNVGIGTTTPTSKLHLAGADMNNALLFENTSSNPGHNYILFKTQGTEQGYIGLGGGATNHMSIAAYGASNNLYLETGSLVRMTILPTGNVGIGTTTPAYLLSLNGGAYCNGTTWTNASDARLKRDIQPMSKYGLSTVMQLKPVTYFYKADKTNHPEVGFIAQEVQNIVPEVVSGTEGDISKGETLGLSYGNLVPVLTKAIQEQQNKIDDLETRLSKLERNNQTADNASFGGNISTTVIVLIIGIGVALFYYRKTYNNFNNKH